MKALVLSSGGVDSTTCIAIAIKEFGKENVSTVSVYYGQKHNKELECAKKIAEYYGLKHYEINLAELYKHSDCPLLAHSEQKIKHKSYSEQAKEGIVTTYVPFRNGLMLSAVATLGMSIYPDEEVSIYLGNHADDSVESAYADCSIEFTEAIAKAINIGTYNKVFVKSPLVKITKADVVKIGLELKVPYELTWSCYEGGEKACGTCGTCIDRLKAFELNGAKDPIEYGG